MMRSSSQIGRINDCIMQKLGLGNKNKIDIMELVHVELGLPKSKIRQAKALLITTLQDYIRILK